MKTPAFLKKGDLVALVTPAGHLKDEKPVLAAEKLLESWGLNTTRGKHLLNKNNYLSGTDKERLQDLQEALDNPKIKAIWAVRGGYGTMRILPKLNFDLFKKHPKWIIGFSDITALHNKLHLLNYKSLHALMPVQLLDSEFSTKAINSLHYALFGEPLEIIVPASKNNKTGSAVGMLVGGNLSILESLLGTPYQINPKEKILFLEEVGEPLYKIDRLLTSLKLAGYFKRIQGLVIGGFTEIEKENNDSKVYQKMILEMVKEYDYPVIFDIPAGHINTNHTLVLGEKVTLNVGEFVSCIRTV
jgi:muramoyltetrapeptide carboxypeptidase